MADTAYWFARTAQAVRDVIDEHGGAIIMTRTELCEAVQEEDPHISECPEEVMQTISKHITCCLRRVGLACCAYQGIDPSVLLIFDQGMGEDVARKHAEADGVSDAVHIELFEHQLAEARA